MIYSKGRLHDMEVRKHVLEALEISTRMYQRTGEKVWKEWMEVYAGESLRLKRRIEEYDYRAEDADYALANGLQRRWGEVTEVGITD